MILTSQTERGKKFCFLTCCWRMFSLLPSKQRFIPKLPAVLHCRTQEVPGYHGKQ